MIILMKMSSLVIASGESTVNGRWTGTELHKLQGPVVLVGFWWLVVVVGGYLVSRW